MTNITITGRVTGVPELRFTQAGAAVASFSVATNRRKFNKQTNEWEDDGADFYNVSVWRKQAENVAESLDKGMEVIVAGELKSRQYETREGEKRTVWEVDAQHVGPSLRFATAKVSRVEQQGGRGQQGAGWGQSSRGQARAADPWAQATEESPF